MFLRRYFSGPIREAVAMRKHVQRLLDAQRDLLSPQAIAAIQTAIDELETAIAEGHGGKIRNKTEELQFAGEKWIKPYPNPVWRENVEVLLVAIAVAMAIRTFFLQPFKIPTGSMQPTLYGITSIPDYTFPVIDAQYAEHYGYSDNQQTILDTEVKKLQKEQDDLVIPTGFARVKEWFEGISYIHVVAQTDGQIDSVAVPTKFLIFTISQSFVQGGVKQTIWFPPDMGEEDIMHRAGLFPWKVYKKGEDVIKMKMTSGDHLFVDRLTYNFRPPERGEIVVFQTQGIPEDQRSIWRIAPDDFYIKRLVGLGGETISLKQDYQASGVPMPPPFGGVATEPVGHLVVNGTELSAATPHFENLYGAKPQTDTVDYHENGYYEHEMIQRLESGREVQIPPGHSFVMGDNTMDSLDSRYWGDFPSSSIIGKSFFVYWPLTKRFGLDNK
jgi:signal peptidase I